MGRFETQWLVAPENSAALADLSGQWIDLVHGRRPPRGIVLDMDSSVSPDPRRARDERLERPLRLHLLSPAVRVQRSRAQSDDLRKARSSGRERGHATRGIPI